MSKVVTFKVSSKKHDGFDDISLEVPESVDDPTWADRVSNPDEDVNELAVQNLIIKVQGTARKFLDQGRDAVQEAVNSYKYGTRGSGVVRVAPTLAADKVKELGFTPEQLEALAAAGMKVPA